MLVLDELYADYHPLLFSIAYRMLGTVSDAEDIVQDVYLRAGQQEMGHIENKKAYLCKMVTNASLDYLKSAQKKREVYTGPWLPEPLVFQENDPLAEVAKAEMISFGVLLLLEKLKPMERAVFVLREIFDYDYATIAGFVNKTEATCRKVNSRVKKKFPLIQDNEVWEMERGKENTIHIFVSAIMNGDVQQLENLLANDVTLYSDGGGKVYAAVKPIRTREIVLRFILHLMNTTQGNGAIQIVTVNGNTGLLGIGPDNVMTVVCFEVRNDQIQDIYIVRNPDKLKHINESDRHD